MTPEWKCVSQFYCKNNTKALNMTRNSLYNWLKKLWERTCPSNERMIVLKVFVLKSNNFMTGRSIISLTFHCSWRHEGWNSLFSEPSFSTSRIIYCDVELYNFNAVFRWFIVFTNHRGNSLPTENKNRMIGEIAVCWRSIDHRSSCIEYIHMIISNTWPNLSCVQAPPIFHSFLCTHRDPECISVQQSWLGFNLQWSNRVTE